MNHAVFVWLGKGQDSASAPTIPAMKRGGQQDSASAPTAPNPAPVPTFDNFDTR